VQAATRACDPDATTPLAGDGPLQFQLAARAAAFTPSTERPPARRRKASLFIATPPATTETDAALAGGGISSDTPLRLWQVLAGHVAFMVSFSILTVNAMWLGPMLVRLHFGSPDPVVKDWQTFVVTAAVPTFMVFSIFWHELLRRLTTTQYLVAYCLAAVAPLAALSLVQNYAQFLALWIIAMAGAGSWTPLSGKLLKHFYSDRHYGRAYGVINVAALLSAIVSVFLVGRWLEQRPDAFRIFFPAAAGLQFVGAGVLAWLAARTRMPGEAGPGSPRSWRQALDPILRLGAVLRADRTFLRYETAFMTYGAAFMICDALLPILATTALGMRYEEYAHSTQMIARVAMLAATMPMGWIHDRIGPVRTSGLAFGILVVFPLLLCTASGFNGLSLASIFWGLGLAGVQMGWMLGPVVLAGGRDRVPQYVAIHATLVGLRGIVFQWLGVLLYQLTGSFTWPLIGASVLFLHACFQMQTLHRDMQGQSREAVEIPAE
jgi:MFS family permease